MNDSVRRVKRAGLEERESAKNKRGGSSKQDNAKTDEVPEGFRLVRSWNPRKCWTSLVREFSAASGGRERHGATLRRNKVHEVAKRVENSGPGRRTSSAVTLGKQGKQTYARLALTYVMVKTLAHAVLLHPLLQHGPARSEVGGGINGHVEPRLVLKFYPEEGWSRLPLIATSHPSPTKLSHFCMHASLDGGEE